ncbi:hypothetical protein MMC10_010660 [Thelotrema lepadinum]|nr:hypothetical protein [Thelotrema lepadinum]
MGSFDRSQPCETHWRMKIGMRSLALLFTLISIATAGYAWFICYLLFLPLGLSLIWNLANIIRRMTARTPVHPGANVGLDLIIWGLFFIILIITYLAAAGILYLSTHSGELSSYNGSYWYSYVGTDNSGSSSSSTTTCNNGDCYSYAKRATTVDFSSLKKYGGVAVASCVFATLSFLLHFILFVFACVDTHRRRHPERHPEYRVGEKTTGQFNYPQQQHQQYPLQQQYPQQGAYPQGQPAYQNTGYQT